MQVLDSFTDEKVQRTKPLLSLHLDAPVRDAKIRRIHQLLTARNIKKFQDKQLLHEFSLLMDEGHTSWNGLQFGVYPLFDYINQTTKADPSLIQCNSLTNFSFLIGLTKDICNCQIKMLPKHMANFSKMPELDRNKLMSNSLLIYYWKLKTLCEEMVMVSATGNPRSDHLKRNSPIIIEEPHSNIFITHITRTLKLIVGRELLLITDCGKLRWMGTREHLLMITDVFCQRFMVLLASEVAQQNAMDYYPSSNILDRVFQWGDKIIAQKGNEGYNLVGKWESLIIGLLLKESNDPFINCDHFYNTMRNDFIQDGGSEESIFDLEDIFKQSISASISVGFQLFGLYRIWGHPTIDSARGILKVKKLACKPRPVNMLKINTIFQKFCEYFCMAYYRKNSTWPNCDITKLSDLSYLKTKIQRNLPIDTNHPDYNVLDWHFIKFGKTFAIPKQFDLSELISDKAMSHTFSKLAENITKCSNIGNAADRSVIIQWIQSELGDPEEFLNEIDINGFGEDETVVGVCPKERELKVLARLFGLLTFKKRMYVVLTESLIAMYFLKYFPEITVMNNQTELLKKQLFATKGMTDKKTNRIVKIVVNIDFNKWNTNMREIETKKIFQMMDNLLGFKNLIQRTHEMFNKSTLYLADGTICPEIYQGKLKASPYVWRGHLGGIEGLRQKGWTLWTVVILKHVMEICNIKAQLMGQGDNQVLICYYPSSLTRAEIIERHQGFLTVLEEFISDLGPPLKREETWESTYLFLYGKYPIYKGCPQPLSMKKIGRFMRCSNEGFPTLDSSLSSLSAGFFDASWMDYSPIIPCVCYTFETLNSLHLHIMRSLLSTSTLIEFAKKKLGFRIPDNVGGQRDILLPSGTWNLIDNDYKLLWSLFMCPRSLGGYPITWLPNVLLRGFPDPVTLDISCLFNLRSSDKRTGLLEWQYQVIENILHPWFNFSKSYDLLGEDPLSLNLLHPSSPGDQLKRLVFDLLLSPGLKKSKKFMNFLDKVKPNQTELAIYLSQMSPKLNPRIMHEIMSSTVTSRAMQVVQRINKTNTLTHLMIKNHEKDLTKKINISELNYFVSVIFQIVSYSPREHINCSTSLANYLRNKSWGLDITGVTVASPLEAFDIFTSDDLTCSSNHSRPQDGFILLRSFNEQQLDTSSQLGPSIPYIGSMTVQKVKGYGQNISKTAAPILTRISQLLTLIGWGTERNSNMANTLRSLLNSITDMNPDLFEARFGEISGSVEHRFADRSTSRGCFLPILYNESSWLSLSTSTLTKYAKGSENVNLNFQSAMILLESWYSFNTIKSDTLGYHFHLTCPSCICPISEEMLDLPPLQNPDVLFPSYPDDPYFWVSNSLFDPQGDLTYSIQVELPITNDPELAFQVFHELTSRYLVENFRKYTEDQGTSGVSIQETHQMSISWIFRIEVHLLISYVLRLLFDYYCYHNLFSFHSLSLLKEGFLLYLSRLPLQWFAIFYPLTMERNLIISLVKNGDLTPPAGVPPSLEQWCLSFKAMLANLYTKDGISPIYFKYTNFSSFPEFYPSWSHLVTHVLTEEISYLQLREAKYWLPIHSIAQSKGGISVSSLFYNNSNNKNHPRYWKSWGELFNLISLHPWYTTYSIPDFWGKFIFVQKENNKLTRPISMPRIQVPPPLMEILFECHIDKTNIGINRIEIPLSDAQQTTIMPGYVAMYKPLGRSTTSIYKAISILSRILSSSEFYKSIMVVGDGAGGFSLASKLLSPESEIIYNSRISPEYVGPQGLPGFFPSDFYYFPELISNVKGIGNVIMGISDISNKKWINQMVKYHPDIIVSDAEFPFNDPSSITSALINLLLFSVQQGVQCLVFKCYLNELVVFSVLIELIHHQYKDVSIRRSFYSNENGTEVYLVGKNLRERTILYDLQIQENKIIFSGATSLSLIKSIWKTIRSITFPRPVKIAHDNISKFLERPTDLQETIAQQNKMNLTSDGYYPHIIFSLWSSQIKLGSFEEWKVKKKFIINNLKADFLRSLTNQHLYYLGTLIKTKEEFTNWLNIWNSGFLYIWLSRDEIWRSGISFRNRLEGQGFCRFRISKFLKKPHILSLIKLLARVKYFGLKKPKVQVSLTYPLLPPPDSSRYHTKHTQHKRMKPEELPASKSLSLSLFGYRFSPSLSSMVSSRGKITRRLIIID